MNYSDAEDDILEVGGAEGVAEEALGQQSDEEELPPTKKIKTDGKSCSFCNVNLSIHFLCVDAVEVGESGSEGGDAGEGSDAGEGGVESDVGEGGEGGDGSEAGEGGVEEDISELQQEVAELDEGEGGSNDMSGAAVGGEWKPRGYRPPARLSVISICY